MSDDLRAKIASEIDDVTFEALAPHAKRGGLFVIAAALDLVDVALAIATNDAARVSGWVETGAIRKPSADEVARFTAEPTKHRFRFAIVQPWVVAELIEDAGVSA